MPKVQATRWAFGSLAGYALKDILCTPRRRIQVDAFSVIGARPITGSIPSIRCFPTASA
jgi:hypothetical protein